MHMGAGMGTDMGAGMGTDPGHGTGNGRVTVANRERNPCEAYRKPFSRTLV
jgi:hypothetical protein